MRTRNNWSALHESKTLVMEYRYEYLPNKGKCAHRKRFSERMDLKPFSTGMQHSTERFIKTIKGLRAFLHRGQQVRIGIMQAVDEVGNQFCQRNYPTASVWGSEKDNTIGGRVDRIEMLLHLRLVLRILQRLDGLHTMLAKVSRFHNDETFSGIHL